MTAREDLIAAIKGEGVCFCGAPGCSTLELMIDAYAHELAEIVRRHDPYTDRSGIPRGCFTGEGPGCHFATCRELAALIDPWEGA